MRRRWWFALAAVPALGGLGLALGPAHPTLVKRPASPAASLLIRDVRVVDVVTGTATLARDVWLKGDRIEAIGPHEPEAQVDPGVRVLEGRGRSLLPGLIDMHCHVGSSPSPPWSRGLPNVALNLERLLYSGVTRTLDPGAMVPDIFELRAELASGARLGPRLHAAGPIFTAVGGHPEPMMRELLPGFLADYLSRRMMRQVGSVAEAERMVREIAGYEPELLKLAIDRIPFGVPRLAPDLAKAIVDAAKKEGLRTVAHIGTFEDARDAGAAGVAAWIHGVYKERLSDAEVAALAEFRIPMVPTMVVFESYGRVGRDDFPSTALEREVTSAAYRGSRSNVPPDYEVGDGARGFMEHLGTQRQASLDNVRRLHAAGVTMIAGSDAQAFVVHGPALHRELGLLAEAGLGPVEVLRAATLYPARFLSGQDDPPFGVVAPGKVADLVLVKGDPLSDVNALAELEAVILGGVALERSAWR